MKNKYNINDLIIELKEIDDFGARPDTIVAITKKGYLLQDNYCGITFHLDFAEAHKNWRVVPNVVIDSGFFNSISALSVVFIFSLLYSMFF